MLLLPPSSHAALHRGCHTTQQPPCSSSSSRSSSRRRAPRTLPLVVSCVAPVQEDVSSSSSSTSSSSGATSSSACNGTAVPAAAGTSPALPRGDPTPSCLPEDLQLLPGELSTINRAGRGLDVDVFRCFGCTKQECKVCGRCLRARCTAHFICRPGAGAAWCSRPQGHQVHAPDLLRQVHLARRTA